MQEAGSIGLPDTNFVIFLRCRQALYARAMICVEHHVCRMAESSQLPPRARMKVHNSVISLGSPGTAARALDHTVLEREFYRHGRILGVAFAPSFRQIALQQLHIGDAINQAATRLPANCSEKYDNISGATFTRSAERSSVE